MPSLSFVGLPPPLTKPVFSILTYGARGDGITDDTGAVNAAISAAAVLGGTVYVPPGVVALVTSNLVVPANVNWWFDNGGVLKIANGVTFSFIGPMMAPLVQVFLYVGTGIVTFVGSGAVGKTPEIYPQWWGAKLDSVTDDSVAFFRAVQSITVLGFILGGVQKYQCRGEVVITGSMVVAAPVNLTNLYGLKVRGLGRQYNGAITIQTNGTVALDLSGSVAATFRDMEFINPAGSANVPICHILMARDSAANSSGEHVFDNCWFYGNSSAALLYNYGSESNHFLNCIFDSQKRSMVITASNVLAVTSPFITIATGVVSMVDNHFAFCTWDGVNTPTGEAVLFEGGGLHRFNTCYVNRTSTLYFIKISNTADFIGFTFEGGGMESLFVTADAAGATRRFDDIRITHADFVNGGNLIDLNKTNLVVDFLTLKNNKYAPGTTINFWEITFSELDFRTAGFATQEPTVTIGVLSSKCTFVMFTAANLVNPSYNQDRVLFLTTPAFSGTTAWGSANITGAVNNFNVTHNLVKTPIAVNVTPLQAGQGKVWVSAVGATTFTISFDTQPGGGTWNFYWWATTEA